MAATSFRLILVPKTPRDPLFWAFRDEREVLRSKLTEIANGFTSTFIPEMVRVHLSPQIRFVDRLNDTIDDACGPEDEPQPPVALEFTVDLSGERFVAWLRGYARYLERNTGAQPQPDLPICSAEWAGGAGFGRRAQARLSIGMDRLGPLPATERVNVIIVDQGFDAGLFPGSFGGGFESDGKAPGTGNSSHATMLAVAVLDIAPTAILYDCPLIPTPAKGAGAEVGDIPAFTFHADAIARGIRCVIDRHAKLPRVGSWIVLNAWSVFDASSDVLDPHYGTDPTQTLNLTMAGLVTSGADVVFAAGNCGQFDPDHRCRANVVGPCRSILGANGLGPVLTVGAVRVDQAPLGYSSNGPSGMQGVVRSKPDVYAPSQFTEDADATCHTTGTSGAAGVVAGVVARLRTRWPSRVVSPGALQDALAATGRPMPKQRVDGSQTRVLIDIAGAAAELAAKFP